MAETAEFLVERLVLEGRKVITYFSELDTRQLELTIYTEGQEWRPREIMAHFLATEIGITRLIERIVGGGDGVPDDFDLDRYNQSQVSKLEGIDLAELIDRFRLQRGDTVRLVSGLSEGDLSKEGRHPFLGVAPVVEMIKLLYRHNQIHMRDIRKAAGITVAGD